MISWLKSREKPLEAIHLALGCADYADCYRLQHQLHTLRCQGRIPDTILTVVHNPVFTIGRSGSRTNILVSPEVLQEEGITVYEVERGGDITYHGPGQLVVYPIIDLREQGRDLKRYIRNLEQALINCLQELGIAGGRCPGFPGVWVDRRKIASVGVYVKHWVTLHGLALNVRVNRKHFGLINPCGMEIEVVSLDDLLEEAISLEEVASHLLAKMEPLFGWEFTKGEVGEFLERST